MISSSTKSFGATVKELMESRGLRVADVAKAIDMPHNTVQRIVTENTSNPTANTLLVLSVFFNVSVDFLLGVVVDKRTICEIKVPETSPLYIPQIPWNFVKGWHLYNKSDGLDEKKFSWVAVTSEVGPKSFALELEKTALKDVFPKKCLIIIDPDAEYCENDYLLVSINQNLPSVRCLHEDAGICYLNSIGGNLQSIKLEPPHSVYGKITEFRKKI